MSTVESDGDSASSPSTFLRRNSVALLLQLPSLLLQPPFTITDYPLGMALPSLENTNPTAYKLITAISGGMVKMAMSKPRRPS